MTAQPFVPEANPILSPTVVTTTAASAASPRTETLTLPRAGIYDVTVVAKLNGSTDHMMTARFSVTYCNVTNDTLLTEQRGTTSKSTGSGFGLDTLTLSAPTSDGVLTATAAWTNGENKSVIWDIRARLATPL